MTKGKALLGVLAGMAAGAALGVLFAPDKGSNTRKKMAKQGEDFADALDKKIDAKFDELLKTLTDKIVPDQPKHQSDRNPGS